MLACDLSVISSKIGDMRLLLNHVPEHLYEVGDFQGLAYKVKKQVYKAHKFSVPILDWNNSLIIFNQSLKKII